MEVVSLISRDGQRVVVSGELAALSGTLRGLCEFSGRPEDVDSYGRIMSSQHKPVELPNVNNGQLLEAVGDYMAYRVKSEECGEDVGFDIPTAMALELLVVADYLDL